jgi:hypothetical protein
MSCLHFNLLTHWNVYRTLYQAGFGVRTTYMSWPRDRCELTIFPLITQKELREQRPPDLCAPLEAL